MKNNRLRVIFYLLMLGFAIYPKVLTYVEQTINPFSYSSIAVAQVSNEQGRIIISPFQLDPISSTWKSHANSISERVAVTSFLVIFSQVTGLAIRYLMFIPLMGLITILLAFTLAKTISKSFAIATLYALFIAYYSNTGNNIYYSSMGFVLMYLFLLIFIKTLESNKNAHAQYISLLFLIFTVSYLTYYSAEFLNLSIVAGYSLLMVIVKSGKWVKLHEGLTPLISLTVAFLIIFMMFDNVFYYYLKAANLGEGLATFQGYIIYAINLLKGDIIASESLEHARGSVIQLYLELIIRIMIFSILGIRFIHYIVHSLIAESKVEITSNFVIYFSFIIATITQMMIYAPLGYITFGYGVNFGALFTLDSLSQYGKMLNNKKKIFIFILMALLIVLPISKFMVIWEDPTSSFYGRGSYTSTSYAASWFMENVEWGNIISDLHISGRLLAESTFYMKSNVVGINTFRNDISLLYEFNQSNFDNVFSGRGYDYLLLSNIWKDRFVVAGGWGPVGPPLGEAISFVNNYTSLNKLYADGLASVYRHEK